MRERPAGPGLPRRQLLRVLAVAPAALAGCAAGRAGPTATPEGAAAPGQPSPAPLAPGALATVRAFRLAADAEPAFVFRAAAARTGEPR
jgi:hypothetical protein